MTAVSFDTLAYSNSLQNAGIPREQAEALAKANAEAFSTMVTTQQLATKQDIESAKHEILKWMVAGMIAQAALLVAIIAFLK